MLHCAVAFFVVGDHRQPPHRRSNAVLSANSYGMTAASGSSVKTPSDGLQRQGLAQSAHVPCANEATVTTHSLQRSRSLCIAVLTTLCAALAQADMNAGRASAAARYEVDRAICLRGESGQVVSTCLREAAAVLAQAKRGERQEEPGQFEANRQHRCVRLPDEQRRDCIARMQGQGTISGSVAEGGLFRELVTVVEDPAESKPAD
jgi:hypothetical protein